MSETKEPKLTFEQALERLERIVAEIEQGEVSLEQSIEKYAQGIKLVEQCRGILDSAERKIQQLARKQDGQVEVEGELSDEEASQSQ